MKHPYFGALTDGSDEPTWEGVIELAGRGVPVTLMTDGDATAAQLDAAAVFPRELPRFDARARAALAQDLREGRDVRVLLVDQARAGGVAQPHWVAAAVHNQAARRGGETATAAPAAAEPPP